MQLEAVVAGQVGTSYRLVQCYMAVRTGEARLEEAASTAARRLGYEQLKDEQLKVVVAFLSGNDVFAVLPTGFGKSICYAVLSYAFETLEGREDLIVVVITPLTAIIKDQLWYTDSH